MDYEPDEDSFAVLKRAREKNGSDPKMGQKTFELPGYEFIPSDAFLNIFTFEEYSHLKCGLFVAKRRLEVTPELKEACRSSVHILGRSDGSILENISWNDSKMIAERLGGKLMTPAEMFCVLDWAWLYSESLLWDLLGNKEAGEWLDGFVRKKGDSLELLVGSKATYFSPTEVELQKPTKSKTSTTASSEKRASMRGAAFPLKRWVHLNAMTG